MKKDDLKASLGRIKPREELVNSTLMKMREEREKEFRRETRFTPAYARGLRVAGAFCAFALVFCLGFFAARQGFMPEIDNGQDARAAELDTYETAGADVAMFSLGDEQEWIVVRGNVFSFNFEELGESDRDSGVVSRASVQFDVVEVENRSDNLTRETISTIIETDVLFYDNDSLNAFVNLMRDEMLFKLVPTGETGWEVEDFSAIQ